MVWRKMRLEQIQSWMRLNEFLMFYFSAELNTNLTFQFKIF